MPKKISITSIINSKSITLQLNPQSLEQSDKINYTSSFDDGKVPHGLLTPMVKFSNFGLSTLSFEVLFDSTGVTESDSSTIASKITKLKSIIYEYHGQEHEPHPVTITWGTLSFDGRLTSLSTNYLLFTPDGSPLRAKLKLSFDGYMTYLKQEKIKKQSSPDLTHIIEFKEGDTLPLLCNKIYHNSNYYIDVARANGLLSIRTITPGTKIYFPPLI